MVRVRIFASFLRPSRRSGIACISSKSITFVAGADGIPKLRATCSWPFRVLLSPQQPQELGPIVPYNSVRVTFA